MSGMRTRQVWLIRRILSSWRRTSADNYGEVTKTGTWETKLIGLPAVQKRWIVMRMKKENSAGKEDDDEGEKDGTRSGWWWGGWRSITQEKMMMVSMLHTTQETMGISRVMLRIFSKRRHSKGLGSWHWRSRGDFTVLSMASTMSSR